MIFDVKCESLGLIMETGEDSEFRRVKEIIDSVFGIRLDLESASRLQPNGPSIDGELPLDTLFDVFLPMLNPKEEHAIRMRFGINGRQEREGQTASYLRVSITTLRSIENTALQKLRLPQVSRIIRKYAEESFESAHRSPHPSIGFSDVIEKVDRLSTPLIYHLQKCTDDLIKLHPTVFEHLIAEFFASWGFKTVRLVGRNPNTSADIFAATVLEPAGVEHRYFIEVKRWKRKVGIEVIN